MLIVYMGLMFFMQEGADCGPAALATALINATYSYDKDDVKDAMGWQDSTADTPRQHMKGLDELGVTYIIKQGWTLDEITDALQFGPVVCLVRRNGDFTNWHWITVLENRHYRGTGNILTVFVGDRIAQYSPDNFIDDWSWNSNPTLHALGLDRVAYVVDVPETQNLLPQTQTFLTHLVARLFVDVLNWYDKKGYEAPDA